MPAFLTTQLANGNVFDFFYIWQFGKYYSSIAVNLSAISENGGRTDGSVCQQASISAAYGRGQSAGMLGRSPRVSTAIATCNNSKRELKKYFRYNNDQAR